MTKVYSATVQQPGNYESKLENASLEDAKAWVSIMAPDIVSNIDWEKLGVYELPNKFSISASEDTSLVSLPDSAEVSGKDEEIEDSDETDK